MLQETNELSNCPVHHCVSLLITSFHKSGSKKKKKTNKQLELHIKILIIIPIFFFFFVFWSEQNTYNVIKSCFFKVREYKVIRTLDTNKKKQKTRSGNMFSYFTIFRQVAKFYIIPAHQSAQAFPCKPQEPPSVSESLAKTPSKEWISLSGLRI